jgi:tetratricopeptide (TPR) repeat protein
MHRMCCIALLLACLAGAGALPAATPNATQARAWFAAGSQAFQARDFSAALDAFRAAVEAGLSGPAVHYNIGVSAWELGRLDEAEAAFLVVAESPSMAPAAYYNLGLISQRRGNEDSARTWFERARARSDDDSLRRLAAIQLGALEPAPARIAPAAPRRAIYLALQAGYDDNVALVADGEVLGVSDTGSGFAEAQFAAAPPLGAGLRLEGSAFLVRYTELGEFDQAGGQLGLIVRRAIGDWHGEAGAGLAFNQLDGDRFEDRRSVALTALRDLAEDWDLRLRYRYQDITGRGPFSSLTGDRHEASLRVRHRADSYRLRLEYRFEINDRESAVVSTDRHGIDAEWTLGPRGRIQTLLGLSWRHSRYSLAEGSQSERRGSASAGLVGPLMGRWLWTARIDWTRNSSSAEIFDYTRYRALAGVEAVF